MIRKTSCVVFIFSVSTLTCAQSTPLGIPAQSASTASVAASAADIPATLPKNPKDLLLLAARVNGLDGGSPAPWQVKAVYQIFDADGLPKGQGTFEEWWAGPKEWRTSYQSEGLSKTTYRNGDKWSITGDQGWTPLVAGIAVAALRGDLWKQMRLKESSVLSKDRKIGGNSLQCLYEKTWVPGYFEGISHYVENFFMPGEIIEGFRPPNHLPQSTITCLAPHLAAVRIATASAAPMILFNDIIRAKGRYIARNIRIINANLPLVDLTVTALSFPLNISRAIFTAPTSASGTGGPVISGHRKAGQNPAYPPDAKNRGIQGVVILEALITKAGNVARLQVLSGPKLLRSSAVNAVKTWKYTPYTRNGQPVQIQTTINVFYTLGN